jgi:hypothetical protein
MPHQLALFEWAGESPHMSYRRRGTVVSEVQVPSSEIRVVFDVLVDVATRYEHYEQPAVIVQKFLAILAALPTWQVNAILHHSRARNFA